MKRVTCGCAATFAAVMLSGVSVQAELLDLVLFDFPDVFSAFIDVTYDSGLKEFEAKGFAMTFDDNGDPAKDITSGDFNITAAIDNAGKLSGGTLTILGDVLGFGPTLLTADIVDFGFMDAPGGDLFNFLFITTGGDLAVPHFGGVGSTIGVTLDADGSDFDGFFTGDFDNLVNGVPGTGTGFGDTGVQVPAPGAVLLGMLGLSLAAAQRRRRRA